MTFLSHLIQLRRRIYGRLLGKSLRCCRNFGPVACALNTSQSILAIGKTPPSWSWMSAACTVASISRPCVSTETCRFFLAAVEAVDQSVSPRFIALDALALDDRCRLPAAMQLGNRVSAIGWLNGPGM